MTQHRRLRFQSQLFRRRTHNQLMNKSKRMMKVMSLMTGTVQTSQMRQLQTQLLSHKQSLNQLKTQSPFLLKTQQKKSKLIQTGKLNSLVIQIGIKAKKAKPKLSWRSLQMLFCILKHCGRESIAVYTAKRRVQAFKSMIRIVQLIGSCMISTS